MTPSSCQSRAPWATSKSSWWTARSAPTSVSVPRAVPAVQRALRDPIWTSAASLYGDDRDPDMYVGRTPLRQHDRPVPVGERDHLADDSSRTYAPSGAPSAGIVLTWNGTAARASSGGWGRPRNAGATSAATGPSSGTDSTSNSSRSAETAGPRQQPQGRRRSRAPRPRTGSGRAAWGGRTGRTPAPPRRERAPPPGAAARTRAQSSRSSSSDSSRRRARTRRTR